MRDERAAGLELIIDTLTLIKAVWDKRSPWSAKLMFIAIVAYAISPIDLIPDILLIAGIIDDIFVITFGLKLIAKLIPVEVMDDLKRSAS